MARPQSPSRSDDHVIDFEPKLMTLDFYTP